MLEFGKMATFRLDDRLQPYDRETLRAEAWLLGHDMAHRFPLLSTDQQEMQQQIEALQSELKTVHEELTKRDELIKVLQQEPETEEKPAPVVGNFVEVHSTLDNTVASVFAYWYMTSYENPKTYFLTTPDGKDICYKADEVRLEKASPDAIAYAFKIYLQSLKQ